MIREARPDDWPAIWSIFRAIAEAGETYAYATDIAESEAKKLWLELPRKTMVCETDGGIVATYYLKTNQAGPGSHVCNCGYMVAAAARGNGLATTMCKHSIELARTLGYLAMQFNFVASTNTAAVHLWSKLGFDTVGRLPRAFRHPQHGYVDALVMYQWLEQSRAD